MATNYGPALFASTAFQAVGQIVNGFTMAAESKANASILEGKARLIDIQKNIEGGQYRRAKGRLVGKSTAAIAASGIKLSGSSAAVIVSSLAQMSIDQAIGQFNFEMEKGNVLAEADAYRRQAKSQKTAGFVGAFSTMLSGAVDYAQYSGGGQNRTNARQSISQGGRYIGGIGRKY